ncbi:hypothetical protein OHA40_29810 [Nocardia sp. NBC_00508]|uniref:hypothetical protein n=1 Tax=Nocardia sp. NBC_00508 TaxID=2975992 RepID=UPI002E81D18E|nr:hypothetical protein [Nocardia sp. NBC_00508]WUD65760.1 hypothetical protein OHA40_29810 [Nocardia sp. NBC_00508]
MTYSRSTEDHGRGEHRATQYEPNDRSANRMEQDADLAQARVFLELLTLRARTLAREIGFAHRGDAAVRQELHAELSAVRRYIDRLHRRFPETAVPQGNRPLTAAHGYGIPARRTAG